jgi:hypothetical protein
VKKNRRKYTPHAVKKARRDAARQAEREDAGELGEEHKELEDIYSYVVDRKISMVGYID